MKKITLLDIKNNLAIILLFPALLGGVWQLLELSKMSISFIRFFSPTQLLPDGLLILFMLSLIYLAIQLGFLNRRTSFKRKILTISIEKPSTYINNNIRKIKPQALSFIDNPIYKNVSTWSHIMQIVLVFCFMLWVTLPIINEGKFTFSLFIILLIMFVILGKIILKSIVILFILFMDNKYDKIKEYFLDKPVLKELAFFPLQLFLLVFLLFLFLILPFKFLSFFHKEYMLPANLKNLDAISSSLKDKNYTSNKISYFNDKYIFIEHVRKDKNITIEILKFDKLFDSK